MKGVFLSDINFDWKLLTLGSTVQVYYRTKLLVSDVVPNIINLQFATYLGCEYSGIKIRFYNDQVIKKLGYFVDSSIDVVWINHKDAAIIVEKNILKFVSSQSLPPNVDFDLLNI